MDKRIKWNQEDIENEIRRCFEIISDKATEFGNSTITAYLSLIMNLISLLDNVWLKRELYVKVLDFKTRFEVSPQLF